MVCSAGALAADVILSGNITAADGQKLGGITVSAKPADGTITTSVYTDESGNCSFPPMPSGRYRVWAQAVGFDTAKANVDLGAARKQGFVLQPTEDFVRQLPGNAILAALPEDTTHERLMKAIDPQQLHRLSYLELRPAAQVR